MTDERRNAPYLRPVPIKPGFAPLATEELRAASWQRTLFVSNNLSLLVFVHVEALSEAEFTELLTEAKAQYIVDLRPVPRFDIGSLSRRSVFAMFSEAGSKYVDLSGRLGVTDRRDSKLNPQVLTEHLRTVLKMASTGIVDGPIALLVEAQHFTDQYVNELVDSLQVLRPTGWDVLRVPTLKKLGSVRRSPTNKTMVFISHANPEDNDFTRWLGIQLTLSGYLVWSDVTKLIGGETFWSSIEEAIRDHSSKVIVVLSKAAQQKYGVLDEINLAVAVERSAGVDNFVLPIRLDDLPFAEVRANLARKNIVDFSQNWASGLDLVLRVLKRDRVPQVAVSADSVAAWLQAQSCSARVGRVSEMLSSNWLPIKNLPEFIEFRSEILGAEPVDRGRPHVISNGYSVVLGGGRSSVNDHVAFVRVEDALRAGVHVPFELSSRQASNLITDLLRQCWEQYASSKGLLPYKLSTGALAWYAPCGLIDGGRATFRDRAGKVRRKDLVGRSEKRNVYWHFAVEARPTLARRNRFALVSHVVFTGDGRAELVAQPRMHALRRQFCKNWWNDRWRDLTLAYLNWFFGGEPERDLPSNEYRAIRVFTQPILFKSPVSIASTDDDRYSKAIEELEWEDLDVVDPDDDVSDDGIEFSGGFE